MFGIFRTKYIFAPVILEIDMLEERVLKEKLVEEIGVYIEQDGPLSPLAARIYALLMLCPRAGHSFDEIVELSKSSKSSVSTSLNLLLTNGGIEYFTKPGERKRFFRLSKSYLKVNLKNSKDHISKELRMIKKVEQFNIRYNKEKYKKHKDFGKLYKEYLELHYANLENTINKMNQLEKTV